MYCKKCGKEIDNDSIFCSSCGTAVSNTKTEETVIIRNTKSIPKNKINWAKPSPIAVIIVVLIFLIIGSIPFLIEAFSDVEKKQALEGKYFVKLDSDNKIEYELIFENNQVLVNEPIRAFPKLFQTKYEYNKKTKTGNFTNFTKFIDYYYFKISDDTLILETNGKLAGTYIDINKINVREYKEKKQETSPNINLIKQTYFNPKLVENVKIEHYGKYLPIAMLHNFDGVRNYKINMPNSFYYGDKSSTNNIGLCNWLVKQYNLITGDNASIIYCVNDSEEIIYLYCLR